MRGETGLYRALCRNVIESRAGTFRAGRLGAEEKGLQCRDWTCGRQHMEALSTYYGNLQRTSISTLSQSIHSVGTGHFSARRIYGCENSRFFNQQRP